MSEWTTTLKISFAIGLLIGLIGFSVSFIITGNFMKLKVIGQISESTDISDEFYQFNERWVDQKTALLFTYSCIGKPIELKVNTQEKGSINVDLSNSNIRRDLEKIIDRNRFYIKISQNNKIVVFLDKGK